MEFITTQVMTSCSKAASTLRRLNGFAWNIWCVKMDTCSTRREDEALQGLAHIVWDGAKRHLISWKDETCCQLNCHIWFAVRFVRIGDARIEDNVNDSMTSEYMRQTHAKRLGAYCLPNWAQKSMRCSPFFKCWTSMRALKRPGHLPSPLVFNMLERVKKYCWQLKRPTTSLRVQQRHWLVHCSAAPQKQLYVSWRRCMTRTQQAFRPLSSCS